MEHKKLYRSRSNRMICGVCGGMAYFLYNRKVFSTFLFIQNPPGDAHAAIRYIAAKRHRGGAKVCQPRMSERMGS